MKTKYWIMAGLLISQSIWAESGNGAGNGGGAWVCSEDKNGLKTRWIELVDRYEAEKEFNQELLEIPSPEDFATRSETEQTELVFQSVGKVFEDRIKPIDHHLYRMLMKELENVKTRFAIRNVTLEVVDDALFRIKPSVPRECVDGFINYVQVANFTEYGTILISTYTYNDPLFTFSNKVALVGHETIYSYFRKAPYQDQKSTQTRELNGYVFSKMPLEQLSANLNSLVYRYKRDFPRVNEVPNTFFNGQVFYTATREDGLSYLTEAAVFDGPGYHLDLPPLSTIELHPNRQIKKVNVRTSETSSVQIFGSNVHVASFHDVHIGPDGMPVEATLASGSTLVLAGNTQRFAAPFFFTKNEKGNYYVQTSTAQLSTLSHAIYMAGIISNVAGTQQIVKALSTYPKSGTSAFNPFHAIELNPQGEIVWAYIPNLKIEKQGKIIQKSFWFDIHEGITSIPGKGDTYRTKYKGSRVLAKDLVSFCSTFGRPADSRFVRGRGKVKSVWDDAIWDFNQQVSLSKLGVKYGKTLREKEKRSKLYTYYPRVSCYDEVKVKVAHE